MPDAYLQRMADQGLANHCGRPTCDPCASITAGAASIHFPQICACSCTPCSLANQRASRAIDATHRAWLDAHQGSMQPSALAQAAEQARVEVAMVAARTKAERDAAWQMFERTKVLRYRARARTAVVELRRTHRGLVGAVAVALVVMFVLVFFFGLLMGRP